MQTLRSQDAPPLTARGGAHRRPETSKTRWWVVAAATLVLVTGAGLATAELTVNPSEDKPAADGVAAPTSTDDTTSSSKKADDLDQGEKPSPSKSKTKSAKPDDSDDKPSTEKPVDEFADLRDGVVKLVNAERGNAGCGKVSSNGKLVAAATGHSKDMATNDYFDHTSQDGRSFSDRAAAQGYNSAIGENIAAGQTSAEAVMDSWMNSEGHRANILNCDAKAIGMGVAKKSDGTLYWTQMFGSSA